MSADLVVLGARVRTLDPARPEARAVAVRAGVLAVVGDERDVLAERGPGTEVLELPGCTLLPGFVDGHTHPLLGVDNTRGVDLTACTSPGEVHRALAAEAARLPPDAWVLGWGLDPNALPGPRPHRATLDDAVGPRPAIVWEFDGHGALASSAALAAAGLHGTGRRSPTGVLRDAEGVPTGLLLEEEAVRLVLDLAPRPTSRERERALAGVLARMAASGLTGGHVMDLEDADLAVYQALDERGELPLRLRLAPWCRPGDQDGVERLVALQGRRGRVWQVAGVKLFLDGTIDGGTAWLAEPDTLGESTGSTWGDPARYTRAVHAFAAAGVPTATHAIGDAAVRHVLDTLAAAPGGAAAPHRVEHLETVRDGDVLRFTPAGVVASMQPTHATDYTFADGSDNWSRRLGPDRAARGWRCADLLAAGATLVLGSDWPVAPFDPRGIMAAAQTRRSTRRPDLPPVGPAQAITAAQAVDAMTRAPAAAAGDQRAGRVAVGCRADLTALAADPFAVPAAELPSVPVVATVMDGVIRCRREA